MNRDLKIGILSVLVLVAGVVLIGASHRFRGTRVTVEFEDGAGLKPGDPVYMQGVDIGEVLDVDLGVDRKVRVHARLEDRFSNLVPADADILITNDKFIFGKKALLIVATSADRTPVKDGQVLKGTEGYADLLVRRGAARVKGLWDRLRGWIDDRPSSDSREIDGAQKNSSPGAQEADPGDGKRRN
jgi:ABC-type transporter Mla subunit MlaD